MIQLRKLIQTFSIITAEKNNDVIYARLLYSPICFELQVYFLVSFFSFWPAAEAQHQDSTGPLFSGG